MSVGGTGKPPRTRARDVTAFTRQLTGLLNAGLALVQALELIAHTARRDAMPHVAGGLARRIAGGEPFASALAAYPAQFDRLYRELSTIGEATGTLALVLARIVEHRERAAVQRGKLRTALAYPCAVLLLAVAVTAALLAFVVPTFQQVFDSFGAALPAPTRAVIAMSKLLLHWGPASLAAFGGLWLALPRLVRHAPRARAALDRALLAIPAAGALVRTVAAARWARALGTLLAAGTPLADALRALSQVTGNTVFDAASARIEVRLRRGERLAHAMRAVGCFPAEFVEPIAVAEESSALDTMLLDCAALAERDADEKLALACACAEPLVVIVLGLAVGALVIALYLPVIELGNVV
ncbi:type II secretion system F family protein [Trinickia dinghuensis]|uniref:Type II secretion system F family protein n=1 Tax=Trinickia dinghuensis TaxID=2291023 RepID=A0A3D8JQL5_9BURK|nr:type II secretion system F family protein [Trinickia dinghuensis]RDU94834.1 type II secretion system F family protein [Trinickia dinghuensis]